MPYLVLFFLVFFSPFSIAITSLGEERANRSAFRTFVRFVLVWFCLFPLPLGVLEGQRFVTVAPPGLFSYLFFLTSNQRATSFLLIIDYSSNTNIERLNKLHERSATIILELNSCHRPQTC